MKKHEFRDAGLAPPPLPPLHFLPLSGLHVSLSTPTPVQVLIIPGKSSFPFVTC